MESDHKAPHMPVVPIGEVWRDLSCQMERMTGCSSYGPTTQSWKSPLRPG